MKQGRQLRSGYTTGTCAAAATAAAALMLRDQIQVNQIRIDTPKGKPLVLDVIKAAFSETDAACAIVKDSGDDPDITNGIEVYSRVAYKDQPGIHIQGGVGIGRVTQKGLRVPVGEWAINPVPRQMIEDEVRRVFGKAASVEVTIEMPAGVALAQKTFNPRLGIVGGLSVLGTTGILEPMSEEALKETIKLELKMLRTQGFEAVILVPGNIGEKQMQSNFDIKGLKMVQMSNYLGFALDACTELGFKRVLIGGHIGKLIKPAAGIYATHNRISSTRMEILVAHLALLGMGLDGLNKIMDCRTTDEATVLIDEAGYGRVYGILAEKAVDYCRAYCFDALEIGFAFFNMERLLAVSGNFMMMLTPSLPSTEEASGKDSHE